AARFMALARADRSPVVRSQLAATAKRLPAADAIPLAATLAARDEDVDDPHIPLLLWWAIEKNAIEHRPKVLALFDEPQWWSRPLVRSHLVERIARRYAAEGNSAGYAACAQLLTKAPSQADVERVVRGAEQGLSGRPLAKPPAELEASLARLAASDTAGVPLVRFALKLGSAEAYQTALRLVADRRTPESQRLELVDLIGQAGRPGGVDLLLGELRAKPSERMAVALLTALAHGSDARIATAVVDTYPSMSPPARRQALSMLAARKPWSASLLGAVGAKKIPAAEITADLARTIQLHADASLDALVEQYVGRFAPQSSREKESEVARVVRVLARGRGHAERGRPLYVKHCATCHTLNGEGNKIGPDLTTADRGNRTLMITSIVDPSLGVRHEFAATSVRTHDGQVATGIVVETTPGAVTLVDAKNQRITFDRDDIDKQQPSTQSLMPEKILDPLGDEELRDLFAYFESGVTVAAAERTLVSQFTAGTDDWTLAGNGAHASPEHVFGGGSPDGWVRSRDAAPEDLAAVAPARFLGDLSRFEGGMAWFDAKMADAAGGKAPGTFGVLTLSDGKNTIRQHLFHPKVALPGESWMRFSGRLTPDAFATDEKTFRAVLANVTRMTLALEVYADAQETIGLDNFTLQAR
ncbi:MAG: c-type cytochrome, partial [Pirellulales bacterium]